MKKVLLLLTLVCCSFVAWADPDWVARTGNSQEKTVVIADLSVTNGAEVYNGKWTIGVFVNGDCRLVSKDNAQGVLTTVNNQQFLTLVIPGNYDNEDDENAEIVIKIRNFEDEIYVLTSDQTLKWLPEYTYGVGSGPRVQLTATLPTNITFNSFVVEKGKEIKLIDQIELTPADAKLPQNYYWDLGNSEIFAEIHDGKLKGTQVTTNAPISLWAGGEELASTTFSVIQHATAINIETNEFNVEIEDMDELTLFMSNAHNFKAYSLDPDDATDEVLWEIDLDFIQEEWTADEHEGMEGEGSFKWTPIKGGTTRIRPYIMQGNDKLTPANDQWITVNIIVPVENAYFNWPEQVDFKCNVGDEDILEHLDKYIKILPLEATDRTYTITDNPDLYGSPNELGYKQVLQLYEDNTIEALAPGYAQLTIQPNGVGGEDLAFTVDVYVYDPLKEVSFEQDPIVFNSDDNTTSDDIIGAICQNIIWQDEDKAVQRGTILVDGVLTGSGSFSANGPMLDLNNTEIPKGESTVTVTLGWNDYSNYNGTAETIQEVWNNGQSFTVKIYKGLDHFEITITPNTADPTTGTATLTPVPADADFNWEDYSLVTNNQAYGDWDAITVTATGNGTYTYSASLPGEWFVSVSGSGVSGDYRETLTAPAKVSLASGWQWKSNNWGTMLSKVTLQGFFGTELIEARTYDDLLYNDPEWGYWGSMTEQTGIGQSVMYKVKMSAAKDSYLDNGYIVDSPALYLNPGWNWVGSPYFYDRLLETVFTAMKGTEGLVVVSKTDGQAEVANGQWSGNLKVIKKGTGYYIYNPTADQIYYLLPSEVNGNMDQGDETPAGARSMRQSVWSYDHTLFASNMSMVAEMPELENAENYTIGAFVDGECRGEGSFENGLAFITVHTNGGEQVNFVLHNELTDEYADIDEIVVSRTRIGSVKAPVMLTSNTVVTGINDVQHSAFNVQRSTFNVDGRAIGGSTKGVSIRKMSDGTVRKVVIK